MSFELTFDFTLISSGLGGSGIQEDEAINCPHKMEWEESGNLLKAALGGQVKSKVVKIPCSSDEFFHNSSTLCC